MQRFPVACAPSFCRPPCECRLCLGLCLVGPSGPTTAVGPSGPTWASDLLVSASASLSVCSVGLCRPFCLAVWCRSCVGPGVPRCPLLVGLSQPYGFFGWFSERFWPCSDKEVVGSLSARQGVVVLHRRSPVAAIFKIIRLRDLQGRHVLSALFGLTHCVVLFWPTLCVDLSCGQYSHDLRFVGLIRHTFGYV